MTWRDLPFETRRRVVRMLVDLGFTNGAMRNPHPSRLSLRVYTLEELVETAERYHAGDR